tara:strand:+ start:191 stop:430 length:240 start_codon:yes stop_codon:yes gene_type:complete
MNCQTCDLVEIAPVTLHDGRVVCSTCICWLHECEARHVLKKPQAGQNEYLRKIVEARGSLARMQLAAEMQKLQKSEKPL